MSENRGEVLAGLGVVLLAAGFLTYAGMGRGVGAGDSYPLMASFRSADGISVGSDVRLAGVKVGTITKMSLNPTTFFADLEISLDPSVQLPTDSAVVISSEGLLGGNFVELIPGGALETLAAGEQIEDTQGSVSLITLLMKFVAGDEK